MRHIPSRKQLYGVIMVLGFVFLLTAAMSTAAALSLILGVLYLAVATRGLTLQRS